MASQHRRVVARFPDAPDGTCRHCGTPCDPTARSHKVCRDWHQEAQNHRAAMLVREGENPVCVDAHRGLGPCEGDLIESDHVIDLADYGDPRWTVPRCTGHHQAKTTRVTRERAERRRGGPVSSSTKGSRSGARKSEPRKSEPRQKPTGSRAAPAEPVSLGATLAKGGAFLALVSVATPLVVDRPDVAAMIGGGEAGTAAVVGGGAFLARRHRAARQDARQRLALAVARDVHTIPDDIVLKGRRWRGGAPTIGWLRYGATVDDREGSPARAVIESTLSGKVGVRLVFTWDRPRYRVAWRPWTEGDPDLAGPYTAPLEAPQAAPGAAVVERVQAALAAYVKRGEVTVAQVGDADAIGPLRFRIAYPATLRDGTDSVRADVMEIINAKAPGRWAGTWDTEANVLDTVRRPPMPGKVDHPMTDISDPDVIPLATDEHHQTRAWHLNRTPHLLVSGGTNMGKTVLITGAVVEATRRGHEVRICDPKRIELIGFRGWPGVTDVATDVEHMIDVVERTYALMERRYQAIEAGTAKPESFRRVLLVIDEAREWIDRVNEHWLETRDPKDRGTEHPVVAMFRSLLRLARAARIRLLVGIQRPDAKVIGGEARDNFGARAALGSLSPDGARMMFGKSDVGTDVPEEAQGRATFDLGDRGDPAEVQVWWTPDPGKDLSREDRAIIEALRPAGSPQIPDDPEPAEPEQVPAPRPESTRRRRPAAKPTAEKVKAPPRRWRPSKAEDADHGHWIRDEGIEAKVVENLDGATLDEVVLTVQIDGDPEREDQWTRERDHPVDLA